MHQGVSCVHLTHPAVSCIAPAHAGYGEPAPVVALAVSNVAPVAAVSAAPAPVLKNICPAQAISYPASVGEYVSPAFAVYAASTFLVKYIVPAPEVIHATPVVAVVAAQAPVKRYIAPAPVGCYVAPVHPIISRSTVPVCQSSALRPQWLRQESA